MLLLCVCLFPHLNDISLCPTQWYFLFNSFKKYIYQKFSNLSSHVPAQNIFVWWSLNADLHTSSTVIFWRPTKWHFLTPNQMTYLDARQNDIFSRPTKWHITKRFILILDQMTYFYARPNYIFWRPTKWHILTPNQMTYFDAQQNDIFQHPTNDLFCRQPPHDIFGCLTLKKSCY